jgi:hypothetical protein
MACGQDTGIWLFEHASRRMNQSVQRPMILVALVEVPVEAFLQSQCAAQTARAIRKISPIERSI